MLLAGALSALAFLALQSYRVVDEELTDAALSRRASVSYLAATVLAEKFDRLVDIGTSLATRVRFRQLIEAGSWTEAMKILREIPRDFPFVDHIALNDLHGISMADVPEAPSVRGQSFAHRDWYQAVIRDGKPYISELYRRTAAPQVNVFAAAIPIRSAAGRLLGILVMQVRSDTYFEWIKGIDVGPEGTVYVVDRHGTLGYRANNTFRGNPIEASVTPAVRRVLQGSGGVHVVSDPAGKENLVVAYQPIKEHGWSVVLEQPAAAAFATRDDQLRRIFFGYALNLTFLASVALLVSLIVIQHKQAKSDRTANAELEQRVAERTAELEISNSELESFSYSVSHDLRAPLRAIDGFAEMLQESCGQRLDDEGKRKLKVIRESSQKMGQLIDDLLAFSRLGRQKVSATQVDMAAMAAEVFEDLNAASPGPRAAFTIRPMPGAWCDRALIRQVWVNLLANAVKFSGKRQDPAIEVGGYMEGAHNVYYARDNGAGFDMRYYNKLFGVFERLHTAAEFSGTGVGLAIVQRIVTRHRGRVWAEGKVGEGATFYFALPTQGALDHRS